MNLFAVFLATVAIMGVNYTSFAQQDRTGESSAILIDPNFPRQDGTRRDETPEFNRRDLQTDFDCQPAGKQCFNPGGDDAFCCSGKCKSNRRCKDVTDDRASTDPKPSRKPTWRPRRKPTRIPTAKPFQRNQTMKPSRRPQTVRPSRVGSKKPTRKPSRRPTKAPTAKPSLNAMFESKTSVTQCNSGEVKITVEILTDRWGSDTSWFLADSNGKRLIDVKNGTYGETTINVAETCVTEGDYNLTVYDEYGDGLCCKYGEGHVRVLLDEREVMKAKSFAKMMTEVIKIGYDPASEMTERDFLYLEAHNIRRKEWHEINKVSYVPLVWSLQLAFESRIWAEKLLANCSIAGIEHEHDVADGENLAKNVGSNELGWGQLYPPDNIVGRWVDFEVYRPYPGNAHLTQALWRPSKYMGCGESVKDFRKGKCRVQVCRYARAGNCDMTHYNATVGTSWLVPMLQDTSRCGPNCAPEGCY